MMSYYYSTPPSAGPLPLDNMLRQQLYSSSDSTSSSSTSSSPRIDEHTTPRRYVPSQNDPMEGSIPLFPTQSLTAPSQYKATMPTVPSMSRDYSINSPLSVLNHSRNYRQVPSQGPPLAVPRSFTTSFPDAPPTPYHTSSSQFQQQAASFHQVVPRSSPLFPIGSSPLASTTTLLANSSLFSEEVDEVPSLPTLAPHLSPTMSSYSVPSQSHSSATPTPPPLQSNSATANNNRRHPFHPQGTPQPKGRGARKPSITKDTVKNDDLIKTLPCDGCDAMFARKHDLDRHRRIHTLEAPYICRGCKRSYRRSDARKRHWDQEPACCVLHARSCPPSDQDSRSP